MLPIQRWSRDQISADVLAVAQYELKGEGADFVDQVVGHQRLY